MSAIPSIRGYTLFCTTQTSLVGKEQALTVEDRLRKIEREIGLIKMADSLSTDEIEQYRNISIDALRARINDEFQIQLRFGIFPRTQISVHLDERTTEKIVFVNQPVEAREGRYRIFERDQKTYATEEEREAWRFRITMIEAALAAAHLFSISIIPVDPSKEQSWYYKKAVFYREPESYMLPTARDNVTPEAAALFEEKIPSSASSSSDPSFSSTDSQAEIFQNLFEVTPQAQPRCVAAEEVPLQQIAQETRNEVVAAFKREIGSIFENSLRTPTPDEPTYSSSISSSTYCNREESVDTPTFSGLFAPFPNFSSEVARPQYHLDNLPPSVMRANVFAEREMGKVMGELESDTMRNSVRQIVDALVDDDNSSGVGLTILQPRNGQIKTLFFEKVFTPIEVEDTQKRKVEFENGEEPAAKREKAD